MKIVIISTGLGIIRRGFEVSSLEWARALKEQADVEVLLLSGGEHPEAQKLNCISQSGRLASIARKLGLIQDGARLQQLSSAPAAKRVIKHFKPDFIWLQEVSLAEELQKWLRQQAFASKLVFCNGAPISPEICGQFDCVINLTPAAHELLHQSGFPAERSAVIPYPTRLPEVSQEKEEWRTQYNYCNSDRIVICVAAWNRHHKRIDYLLNEMAEARKTRPELKLLLCGQPTEESEDLKREGERLLGSSVQWQTLPFNELVNAYNAADLFVLASKNEAFGAVIAEAAAMGMPMICNDFPASRFILGDHHPGIKDLSSPGSLSEALVDQELFESLPDISAIVDQRFSPNALAHKLIQFLNQQSPSEAR